MDKSLARCGAAKVLVVDVRSLVFPKFTIGHSTLIRVLREPQCVVVVVRGAGGKYQVNKQRFTKFFGPVY